MFILDNDAFSFSLPPGHLQCQDYKDGGGSQKETNSKKRKVTLSIFRFFLQTCIINTKKNLFSTLQVAMIFIFFYWKSTL